MSFLPFDQDMKRKVYEWVSQFFVPLLWVLNSLKICLCLKYRICIEFNSVVKTYKINREKWVIKIIGIKKLENMENGKYRVV